MPPRGLEQGSDLHSLGSHWGWGEEEEAGPWKVVLENNVYIVNRQAGIVMKSRDRKSRAYLVLIQILGQILLQFFIGIPFYHPRPQQLISASSFHFIAVCKFLNL